MNAPVPSSSQDKKDRQAAGFPALIADDQTTSSRKCHIKNRPKGRKMTKGSKYVQGIRLP
jgi:hypothetical protein